MIDEYIRAIEEAIASLGDNVRSSNIFKDEREAEIVFLRGEIKFADDSSLHFREFVQLKQGQPPNRYKYAFHYQSAEGTMPSVTTMRAITLLYPQRRITNISGNRMWPPASLPIYSRYCRRSKGSLGSIDTLIENKTLRERSAGLNGGIISARRSMGGT